MANIFLILVAGFAVFGGNNNIFAGGASTTQALAEITSAAGDLAGATANASIKVKDLGIFVLSTSASAVGELWHGVDLVNVSLTRTTVKAGAPTQDSLVRWIIAKSTFTAHEAKWFADMSRRVDDDVNQAEFAHEVTHINGSFVVLWTRTRYRRDGSAATIMVATKAVFQTRWVNPGWGHLGFETESQTEVILDQLRLCLQKAPPVSPAAMSLSDRVLEMELGLRLGPSRSVRFAFKCATTCLCVTLAASLAVLFWFRPDWRPRPTSWPSFFLKRCSMVFAWALTETDAAQETDGVYHVVTEADVDFDADGHAS